jgi:hypothetical protein
MKTSLVFAALSLVALAASNTANAGDWRFKNMGAFTATGSITVTAAAVSLPCTAVLQGTTTAPKITSATFSGLSCLALTAGNLPWKMHANAQHGLTINDVSVQAVVLGVCGPGRINSQLNTAGVMQIAGAGLPGLVPCSVSGSLTTKPQLTIIAKK